MLLILNSVRLMAPGLRSAVAVLVGSCCFSAWAVPIEPTLDPVVVTANRAPMPLHQVLSHATVIGREEIERQGAGDIVMLLKQQAGVEVDRDGGPGSTSGVFLRGAESRFTAVLIDGVRVDSQAIGGASWSGIPLAIVDRIEIVRGPLSAVYGSDAVAGVIQIFTKKGRGAPSLTLGAGMGSHRTAKADVGISGGAGAFDYAAAFAAARSHGFNAIANPASFRYVADTDGYRDHSANARVGWQLNGDHRFELASTYSRMDAQYDEGMAGVDDHSLSGLQSNRAVWSAQWLKAWHAQLQLAESTEHYELAPSFYDTQTKVRTASWQNDLIWGDHAVHLTWERREDMLVNASLYEQFTGERSQNGLAAAYQWRHAGYAVQFNARTDDDSEFGRRDTGAVAGGWQMTEAWRLRASVGTSFRAPTLYQRFSQYGNTDLKPESGLNRELGLQYGREGYTLESTLFRNKVDNLIGFAASRYNNTSRAVLQGLSTSAGMPIGTWRLTGSVDLQSAKDANKHEWLVRRARHHMSVRVDGPWAGWDLGAQVLASGYRDDQSYDASFNKVRVRLAGYALLNLSAQRTLLPGLNLLLRLDNAFDKDHQTAVDYRSNPRTGFVGLKWTLGS